VLNLKGLLFVFRRDTGKSNWICRRFCSTPMQQGTSLQALASQRLQDGVYSL
jgi:hypothetical protein